MRHIVVKPYLTIEEIGEHRDRTRNKRHYRWWQIIWLAAQGTLQASEIAEITGMKLQSVYNLMSRYNRLGPAGLTVKPWGGPRRQCFSYAQEREILSSLYEQAQRGEITTASQIQEAVERALGRSVSRSSIYALLARCAWRKVVPRPRHPKQNPTVQETFKKNSPN